MEIRILGATVETSTETEGPGVGGKQAGAPTGDVSCSTPKTRDQHRRLIDQDLGTSGHQGHRGRKACRCIFRPAQGCWSPRAGKVPTAHCWTGGTGTSCGSIPGSHDAGSVSRGPVGRSEDPSWRRKRPRGGGGESRGALLLLWRGRR